jgi:hypothetical protein
MMVNNNDPKAIDPKLLKDRQKLLIIGERGLPYSKYQIATVELTKYNPSPSKNIIIQISPKT